MTLREIDNYCGDDCRKNSYVLDIYMEIFADEMIYQEKVERRRWKFRRNQTGHEMTMLKEW